MRRRKHAIIVAHPNPESFTAAMAQTYAKAVRALGDTAVIRDLYAMSFDPSLKADELPAAGGAKPRPDVAAEREVLADADVFAFFYPLWFNAPPAMLKGYVDRVFGQGFGFEPRGGSQAPRLVGKTLISFTASGAPEHWVRETGAFAALYALFDKHLAAMCGLTVIAHIHFGDIVPGSPAAVVNKAMADVRMAVQRYFTRALATPP